MAILIAYTTTDGHTVRISEFLRDRLREHGADVTVTPLAEVDEAALGGYDAIMLGASIRYGKHQPAMGEFIRCHAELLGQRPGAFFSVSAVARKAERRTVAGNKYVRRFLASIPWQPPLVGIFGGRICYPMYGFWDRLMIRLIMKMTKGPTDPDTDVVFTDWDEVRAFADRFLEAAEPGSAPQA